MGQLSYHLWVTTWQSCNKTVKIIMALDSLVFTSPNLSLLVLSLRIMLYIPPPNFKWQNFFFIWWKVTSYYYLFRLNFVKILCKTHILPFQSQHNTSSIHIFKNKYNYTQSILIPIYKSNQNFLKKKKSNQIKSLLKYY